YITEEVVNTNDPDIRSSNIPLAFFQIALAVGIGYYVSLFLASLTINGNKLTVPVYIGSMLIAALMRNVFKDGSKYEIKIKEVQALGDMFLAIFLAQAIMDLKLWELLDLALPLFVILFIQVIVMIIYAIFVTFNLMGKDYDAAILAAGHCGFGLGATPNGVANMNAVTLKYGPSIKAFFVLPIVGGLFIDFFNSFVITTFISIFSK
ncbi:MAG: sodium/glutamate symporter, partial [Bacilli bacterium]